MSQRRMEVERLVEALQAEAGELEAFDALLGELEAAEIVKGAGSSELSLEPRRARIKASTEIAPRGQEAVVRRAGEAGSTSRYDEGRKLFMAEGGFQGGSTVPERPSRGVDPEADPLMARAMTMLETPGLIHAMLLAERTQTVLEVDAFKVPEAALGLPLAEAYRSHVFSVEALRELADPVKGEGFLEKLKDA